MDPLKAHPTTYASHELEDARARITRELFRRRVIQANDEEGLHALLGSLEDGEQVTTEAEPRFSTVSMIPKSDGSYVWVRGPVSFRLRSYSGNLQDFLHSVTARRPVVQRWEREKKEHLRGAMSAGTHTSGHTLDLRGATAIHNQPNHDRAACTWCYVSKLLQGEES